MKILQWIQENKWKCIIGSGGLLVVGYVLKEIINAEVECQDLNQSKLDKYQESRILGQGTFGKVKLVVDSKTKQQFALKVIKKSKLKTQFIRDQIQNEIYVMKNVRSEHIIELKEYFESDDSIFMVLELCETDLENYLFQKGQMVSEKEATEILKQLLLGFRVLYKNGYIHRDIKPANFLISKGKYKIADFGLACKADFKGKTLIKEQVGTPMYMSPQILMQVPYSVKSDIFSIGVLYYRMIFGVTPWPARDMNSFKKAVFQIPLRFPYEKPISKEAKSFIKKCLKLEESDRMGWDEIFKHPLFDNLNWTQVAQEEENQKQKQQTLVYSETFKSVITQLQDMVYRKGIKLISLFKEFDKDQSLTLDENEFFQLLLLIDPNIQQDVSNSVFKQLDKDQSGSLDFKEFHDIFEEFDFRKVDDFISKWIFEIREIIIANNWNLLKIFEKYDQDHSNEIDLEEFKKMMNYMLPGLKQKEIELLFKRIDEDQNNTISFSEFYITFSNNFQGKITHITQSLNKKSQGDEAGFDISLGLQKGQENIHKLKQKIKQQGINLQELYKRIDTSGDGLLQFSEFHALCEIIDAQITEEEVQVLFMLFNTDDNGSIDYKEFCDQLE